MYTGITVIAVPLADRIPITITIYVSGRLIAIAVAVLAITDLRCPWIYRRITVIAVHRPTYSPLHRITIPIIVRTGLRQGSPVKEDKEKAEDKYKK